MKIKKVAVFNASSRMGLAQVKQLVSQSYQVRAITRQADIFVSPEYDSVEIMAADYTDLISLERACEGVDAIFFQPPSIEDPRNCINLADAASRVNLKRFIYNSTMWAPDFPCSEPGYDAVLSMENLFVAKGLPIVIFRPVLFMDNLLTKFAKQSLVKGIYRYCHKPGLRGTWISMDDVARFMIEGLKRNELLGERLTIGGPQTLAIEEVLEVLSRVIGKSIKHEYVNPRDFAATLFDIVKGSTFLDEEAYKDFFDSFYTFNNDSEYHPFEVDMVELLARIPLELMPIEQWAKLQDWREDEDVNMGSSAG